MPNSIPKEFKPNITDPLYLTRIDLLFNIQNYAKLLGGKTLDFGCGKKPYKSLFTNADEYIGLDFEGEGHSHKDEQIDVFYDGKKIPFPDNYFDSVFSSEVFEHIFNLEEIIKELKRVLKNQGLILITCPFSICEHEVPNDFARYTSFGIKHMLEKEGFVIQEFKKTGDAVKTIWQLRITYWGHSVLSKLKNIPVVRTIARKIIYTSFNTIAIFSSWLLPKCTELYLNNIVLAKLEK
jgi:SAM-dependent methyltransferase